MSASPNATPGRSVRLSAPALATLRAAVSELGEYGAVHSVPISPPLLSKMLGGVGGQARAIAQLEARLLPPRVWAHDTGTCRLCARRRGASAARESA